MGAQYNFLLMSVLNLINLYFVYHYSYRLNEFEVYYSIYFTCKSMKFKGKVYLLISLQDKI